MSLLKLGIIFRINFLIHAFRGDAKSLVHSLRLLAPTKELSSFIHKSLRTNFSHSTLLTYSSIMAKSARASKIKTNNSKLKSRVFGPIETARTERLSAKLLELASQPKPTKKDSDEMAMDIEGGTWNLLPQ